MWAKSAVRDPNSLVPYTLAVAGATQVAFLPGMLAQPLCSTQTGIVYLGWVPPTMTPSKLRSLMS